MERKADRFAPSSYLAISNPRIDLYSHKGPSSILNLRAARRIQPFSHLKSTLGRPSTTLTRRWHVSNSKSCTTRTTPLTTSRLLSSPDESLNTRQNNSHSDLLPHLTSAWAVDQAIVQTDQRVVVIRFGTASDPDCMIQDEVLSSISAKVQNFAVIYCVDKDKVR